jgi:hypothetical protein
MPKRIGRVKRLLISAALAVTAMAALPSGAMAAECPLTPTTQAFAAFGDANQYFLAPGGDFDSLKDWTVRGKAALVEDVNPLKLSANRRSVHLETGESVTSVSFCVDSTMPHLRFTAKAAGSGQLDVTVQTQVGRSTDSSGGSVSPDDHRSWHASRYVELKTDGIRDGRSGTATVTFRSQGDWHVDDVFVDPYRK